MMIEVSLTVIISIAAICLSAYSITIAKKRGDNADLKELSTVLATLKTKLENIEDAVLGKPTVNERVAGHEQKLKDHEGRINKLEEKASNCP